MTANGNLPILLLAVVGIAGVLWFAVTQRTREIGLRLAVGARPADILHLILSEAATLVVAGLAVGLGGCAALSGLIRGLLYGVTATDPWAYFIVSVLLIVIALSATYVPVRSATRMDPVVALRHE